LVVSDSVTKSRN